jgi:outer membrane protein assembly factor BamB
MDIKAMAAGPTGIYVTGTALYGHSLSGQISAGGDDAFVRKYNPDGQELWTRQFGSQGRDSAATVAVDDAGGVYVVGTTSGYLPGAAQA